MQAIQPVAGFAHGSGNHRRLKEAYRFTVTASMSSLTVLAALIALCAPSIVRLLAPGDADMAELGASVLRFSCLALPFTTFVNCTGTLFQSIRESARSSVLVLGRQVCVYVPAAILLSRLFGLDGLMVALPAADLLSCLAALIMIRRYFRRLGE